jgi:CBS domain-containing protein
VAELRVTDPIPARVIDLGGPVSKFLRPSLKVESVDSLALAANRFRQNGAGVLPVVEEDRLVGVIINATLAETLGSGVDPTDAVGDWMTPAETILNRETGAEALRRLEGGGTLVVIDEEGRVLGLVSACDLWPRRRVAPRPAVVGGMATPFGVYLTNGSVSGGVPKWALLFTGATMFVMLYVAMLAAYSGATWLDDRHLIATTYLNSGWMLAAIAIFFLIMRLSPLAGTHGAEHQTVHALEREEDLKPEIIRRMPRVHPRCGTNLAAGASIFLSLFEWDWTKYIGLPGNAGADWRLIVAVIATVVFWRRVGGFLQYFVTTKRPNDKQLQSGIKAANMLLERFALAKVTAPSLWQRIWASGMLHVLLGASLMSGLILLFERWHLLPQVFLGS